ncbi:MAG: hypothetical protein UR89_C0004G0020 [Candidatus Roizmanbacteria bacterium GW2011_GWA2_35_8]|uniref:Peptidase S9 prolyl oligopeptidase catalytic domain-containing protein n=1 Tax=Candidatus Roizmanbacteria bacterium GW2011_GWA2_35_8 TaxID=1618479 RepID=A0A0G0DF35_9BACT|nr:MAG: hypothetical protein UR89_C0004G0020 [Candidatus Roizmanbacteria bacterium GW2011_GWA2_35_8]
MFSFRKKIFGKQNNKIIFLICGWPGKIWHYYFTAKILEINGYRSIVYEYDDNILTSSIKDTIKNTNIVKQEILNQINKFKKQGLQDFSIFGTSYGSIITFMIVNQSKDISKIIINLTGFDLAETVWTWNKGKDSLVKNGIVEQNISLKSLKEKWRELSPINNSNKLEKAKILFYLAKKDEVIPYKLQTKLLEKLKKINHRIQIYTDRKLNHLFSALLNLLWYKRYAKFLNDKN